jgi:hypothetical protein
MRYGDRGWERAREEEDRERLTRGMDGECHHDHAV